jgi:hypothetical protein
MSPGLKELLEKTASCAAVSKGLQQVQRGEFVSDVEMQSFWKR